MKASDFNSVIGSITNDDLKKLPTSPMGANGQPISARQIQDGALEAIPDRDGVFRGKYQVFLDGQRDGDHLVKDATTGKPWTLDLANPALDAALRQRNPRSYMGAPVAPLPEGGVRPTPSYRSAPGTIAPVSEVALNNEAQNP